MPADLHLHTNFSDGTDTPEVLVTLAKDVGLTTIAVTDHDTADGVVPAIKKGEELGLTVIPGIEFSTDDYNTEIHILGYFVDLNNASFQESLKKLQKGRQERIYKMCEKLQKMGINLAAETVLKMAGNQAPGRPHVARAMVQEGFIDNFRDAFRGFIEFGAPAYTEHYKMKAIEAIKLVLDAGGLPVYAHPGVSKCDQVIPEFVAAGLAGIEAIYPLHNEGQTQHYINLAIKHGLLITGGSDHHGQEPSRRLKLGEFLLDDKYAEKLKNEYLRRNKS